MMKTDNPVLNGEAELTVVSAPYLEDSEPTLHDASWRGGLCGCITNWQCPMALLACSCPQVIWAQIFYELNKRKPKYALCGYYLIIAGFTLLSFVAIFIYASVSANTYRAAPLHQIMWLLSIILLLTLYRSIRNKTRVRGNYCNRLFCCCGNRSCCGKPCCPDECSDCCEATFCQCCSTMRLGHHMFDYDTTNPAITYEPINEFDLMLEDKV